MKLLTTFSGNSDFVQKLVDAEVEFLVIGSFAVVFHNCRDQADDLDLLLNPPAEFSGQLIQFHPELSNS